MPGTDIYEQRMTADDVLQVLDELNRGGIRIWVDGGWGVDALVGHETRAHADLDLAIDITNLSEAKSALEAIGYRHDESAEPGLPARLVMTRGDAHQVDFHPLRFDEEGDGWQQLSDSGDEWGAYPGAELRSKGKIGGRIVPCLSAELQRQFHQGYKTTDKDRHDLRLLAESADEDRPT